MLATFKGQFTCGNHTYIINKGAPTLFASFINSRPLLPQPQLWGHAVKEIQVNIPEIKPFTAQILPVLLRNKSP